MPLCLGPGVLNSEIRLGVGAHACTPLPSGVVDRDLAIDQMLHEELLSEFPGNAQVLAKEHGHNHADAVVNETCGGELSHASVDHRKSRAPFTPRDKPIVRHRPRQVSELRLKLA